MSSSAEKWAQAKNILCVRLDTIGDVLMTTPAIRALKEGQPERKLTLFTSPPGAAVAPFIPEIDETLIYDAPWMKATAPRQNSQPEFAIIEQLRQKNFDAAVIFTVYSQNPLPAAFMCYMADIPLRLAHCHENPYQLLTDWIEDPEPAQGIRHEVRRHLDLVAQIGSTTKDERMSARAPEIARQKVQKLLTERGIDTSRPWLILHAGATAPSRRYPPESFAKAARTLALENDFQIVLTGTGLEEQNLVEFIQAEMNTASFSLVDALNLGEMIALTELAPLLLSNNTGPVHIAAAVGTPVVDLYALTNPQHTPWNVPNRVLNHDVPCKFCYKAICPEGHHNCLRLVTPDIVVQAVKELYNEVTNNKSEV